MDLTILLRACEEVMAAASLLGSRPAGSYERGSWRQATSAMPPRAEMSYPSATLQEPARCPRPLPSMVRKAPRGLRPSARRRWRSIFDCSRAYIGKLEAEGVIQRQGDGFPLDQSRVAYLRYLRRESRRSPRGDAAVNPGLHAVASDLLVLPAAFTKRKTGRRRAQPR